MIGLLLAISLSATAAQMHGVVGVTAIDLNSGRTLTLRGGERFPMGSVYKFPIALAVLREVDRGKLRLDAKHTIGVADFREGASPIRDRAKGKPITVTLRQLVLHMLRDSDNTACDYLLKLVPPARVTAYLREIGVKDIDVNRSEQEIAREIHATADGVSRYANDRRDTSTPDAMAELLRLMAHGKDGLSRASHNFAMDAMVTTKTKPNRIKGLLPAGTIVAHKTGTMPGTLNDVGIVTSADGKRRFVVAILTKASNDNEATREKAVAKLAADIYAELAR